LDQFCTGGSVGDSGIAVCVVDVTTVVELEADVEFDDI
jgi:hypothetical protein